MPQRFLSQEKIGKPRSSFVKRRPVFTRRRSVRISSCGIVDVLMYDARQDLAFLQQEDLTMFGRLLFALCCNNLAAVTNLPKSLDTIGRLYSQDLKNVALWLISKP